jgi:thioredoxin 1
MANSTKVFTVTDQNFEDEIGGSAGVAMVDFWATWCGPCRIVAPVVEQLADEYGEQGLRVGKLDVDENPQTAARYGVRSIPTILFFKDGQLVDRLVGAMPKPYFEEKVQGLL